MPVTQEKPTLAAANHAADATADDLASYYRQMLLIRRFEEKAGQLYGMGLIGGFLHLYIGQEAVVVGVESAITTDDPVVTSYRCHAHTLMRGATPHAVMAELTGREAGTSKGKGGSMHLFSPKSNFFGGHGIVGAQVPIGTGIAFALQYRDTNHICVTYYGDGASSQGQVFEAFNMAALWKLPIVYLIENNQYGMGTSVARARAQTELFRSGEGVGIRGIQCDGMDVVAVKAAMAEAASYVRAGNGPMIIEAMTYRYRGHSMSDPAKYRTKEEVREMREERDPISQVGEVLIERGFTDESGLKAIDKEIRAQVNEAADFAQNSPEPDRAALFSDIYVDG